MSLQTQVSAAEWQARCTLATLYRLIAHFRMTDLIDTHISLRVPDEPNHFLINHYGLPLSACALPIWLKSTTTAKL